MSSLLSGKVKKISPTAVSADRYNFLQLSEAEPDLGVPSTNGYVLSSTTTGVRSWIAVSGGGGTVTQTIAGDTGTDNVTLGTDTLTFVGGTGLASTVTNNTVTMDIDSTVATLTGTQTLTNKTIAAGSNTISGLTNSNLSGTAGITNANLANSSITINSTAVSLGGSITGLATTAGTLAQFAATTSLQLAGVISDETGSGSLVFATSPTLVTPILGTPTSGNFSTGTFTWPTFNQNTSGSAASLSATLVTTSGGTGTSTAFTLGSVVFAGASGVYSQNNSNLFWDNTNTRLGLGTATPTATLDITKATNGNAFIVNAPGGGTPNFTLQGSGEQTFRIYNSAATGSTRTSIKLASRLNTDWEWIAYTDFSGTGVNDLTIANTSGIALSISNNRNVNIATSLIVSGDLVVNGTTTTINTNTLSIDDKNIELGSVPSTTVSTTGTVGSITGTGPWTATITGMSSTTGLIVGSAISATAGTGTLFGGSPTSVLVSSVNSVTSITYIVTGGTTPTAGTVTTITTTGATDTTANGGGITLKGATDKTIIWDSTNTNWTASEHWNLASGKFFKINNVGVLSATTLGSGVTASSLTSVGTISTGTWEATDVGVLHGGTGASDAATARVNLGTPERTTAFPASNESSIRAADIRNITNPTTGLGYADGVRFRFSSLNDDSTSPYADVIDLSTYTDSSGGGFNALYFGKNSQVLLHKYAAAAATTWTTKTIAYLDSNITGTSAGLSATLVATSGGTGQSTYAIGDLLQGGATNTLTKLAAVATGNVLLSGGVTTASSWGKVGLTTHVSGTLPIANGGTNGTATPTLGGVIVGTGTAYASTAAGTAGQALVSNGASAPTWQELSLTNIPDAWTKKSVGCATTAALTLNTAQTTIDGVTLSAATRVLVKDQATASQNGIYTAVTTTTWVRATDADTISKIAGAHVNVDAGTVNGGLTFDNDLKTTDTLGTTAMLWYRIVDTNYTIPASQGGTGVANNAAATVTSSGNFAYTRTLTGTTNVTFPTTGTLATLTGTETLANKTLTTPNIGDATATKVTLSTGAASVAVMDVFQATVATVTPTAIDSWAIATYRSAKYTVQITQGSNYQVSEILVAHNGTVTFNTQYAQVETNGQLATFSTDISATNARLLVTMGSATSATINIQATLMAV